MDAQTLGEPDSSIVIIYQVSGMRVGYGGMTSANRAITAA